MKLSIALPGLLWRDIDDIAYLRPHTPNLDKLIKHASIRNIPYSYSDWVYSSYTNTTTSLANEIANKLGYTGLYSTFLLAEPTYLRADRDRLLICESELLQLNDDEVASIISSLNNHFGKTMQVFRVNPNLWLIGLNMQIAKHKYYPILDIIGENIDEYLPDHAIEFTRLLNEIQMLLFSLELNQNREKGLLKINSLWLWDRAIKDNLINNYTNIYTNSQSLNNDKIRPLPQSIKDGFIDNSLIIIDNLYYPCCYRDSHSYLHNLSVIDDQIITLLQQHIKQFDCLEILIPTTDTTMVITLNKNDKYKFWKNLTFSQLLKEQNAL